MGLSDEDTEDAIYDSQAVRTFVGVDGKRLPMRRPDSSSGAGRKRISGRSVFSPA